MNPASRNLRPPRVASLLVVGLLLGLMPSNAEAQVESSNQGGGVKRSAEIVNIALPIVGTVDSDAKRAIARALDRSQNPGQRPIIILAFESKSGQNGRGSEFERCLSLARYLSSDALRAARVVAYVPHDLIGHAVLPVLACEEIIVDPDATLGDAGIDVTSVDDVMRSGYREAVERRRTVPVAIALGMLDRELTVQRVETLDGVLYVLDSEVAALRATTTVSSIETIVQTGDLAKLTGRDLRLKFGFVSHLAGDRPELATALGLTPDALSQDPLSSETWRPLLVDVSGNINGDSVNWILQSTQDQTGKGQFNFVCVMVDSPGGSATDSLRLAHFLASLDPASIRTVAFVEHEARGDAALIALACDHLVMTNDALLGGPGAEIIEERDRESLYRSVRALAEAKGRDWSLFAALVDSQLQVFEYTQPGREQVRYFSAEELAGQPGNEKWSRGDPVSLKEGLIGRDAEQYRIVKHRVESFSELRSVYGLDVDLAEVRPNWAHRLIEQMASPRLAALLLFVAYFACFAELSSPGLGIPGFVAAVCFVIYFWSNFLNGTAGWLEVLLFLAGAVAIVLELFLIPGVGIFGIGGGLLMISSIVLASQTFVIPRNSYQLSQFPQSLATVVAAIAGAVAALFAMRRYLPETPFIRGVLLAPLNEDDREDLDRREALADFGYLVGKRGTTVTLLNPSGKARFGDDVVPVVSEGSAIDSGLDVLVTKAQGNRIVVRQVA